MQSKPIFTVALIILLSAVLLTIAATQKNFWEDEAFTSRVAQQDAEDVNNMIERDVHPPLFLSVITAWGRWFGYDELGLRSFSILFSLITLLLTYIIALDLFDRRVAVLALALLAISPIFIMFGHNGRYYSLSSSLTLLIILATYRFKQSGNWAYLLVYLLSSIAFINLIFAAVVVLVVANLWWFVRWWRTSSKSILQFILWILAQIGILLLYIPVLLRFFTAVERFSEVAPVANWYLEMLKRAAYFGFVASVGETFSPLNPLAWVGIVLVLVVTLYTLKDNFRSINFWLPVSLVFMIAAANLLISMNAAVSQTWQNLSYRSFYLYPFLAIWLAVGIRDLPFKYSRLATIALLAVYGVGLFNYFTGRQYLRPAFNVPWRDIFSTIQDVSEPDALVICGPGDTACLYYSTEYGYQGKRINDWREVSPEDYPSEIWWVKTNLSRGTPHQQEETKILEELSQSYSQSTTSGFAPHDEMVKRMKSYFLKKDGVTFRVELFHFYNP